MKEKKYSGIHISDSSDTDKNTHIHEGITHEHKHQHQQIKTVLNRLSRAKGHLEAVRRMVEDGKDCSEVLIQLSAVIGALNKTGKIILEDHIENCIVEAVESGDRTAIENLNMAISRFIK
ncbi:metal-sensing transcriptional repressor [Aminipila sp.]|uniref:metal-sensing transcriptional repressor n=1 Tax=Aminipila sp. TaxID=2060095 RepID=UPI0028A2AC0D|nr:metal-sensing transcriptional repressor [Aminipila sp.]